MNFEQKCVVAYYGNQVDKLGDSGPGLDGYARDIDICASNLKYWIGANLHEMADAVPTKVKYIITHEEITINHIERIKDGVCRLKKCGLNNLPEELLLGLMVQIDNLSDDINNHLTRLERIRQGKLH